MVCVDDGFTIAIDDDVTNANAGEFCRGGVGNFDDERAFARRVLGGSVGGAGVR